MDSFSEDFKAWMDVKQFTAETLSPVIGKSAGTIANWRSIGVPERSSVRKFLADFMANYTPSTTEPETSILRIEFDDEELDLVSNAAGIVDTPIREFIRRAAVHQARVKNAETAPKTGPVSFDPPSNLIELPFFGTVAAGLPGGPVDVADGTHPAPGEYDPATHYVLRVHGQSMEPDYADGSFIVCRKLKSGEFATKGQDVIACDAAGAYFKRLLYTKDGKKGDSPRKAKPHLTSINPDYPEITPLADCPIVAVVVGKA